MMISPIYFLLHFEASSHDKSSSHLHSVHVWAAWYWGVLVMARSLILAPEGTYTTLDHALRSALHLYFWSHFGVDIRCSLWKTWCFCLLCCPEAENCPLVKSGQVSGGWDGLGNDLNLHYADFVFILPVFSSLFCILSVCSLSSNSSMDSLG